MESQKEEIRGNETCTLTAKFKNNKDKVIKVSREEAITHKEQVIMQTSGSSTAMPDAGRQWSDIFKTQNKRT